MSLLHWMIWTIGDMNFANFPSLFTPPLLEKTRNIYFPFLLLAVHSPGLKQTILIIQSLQMGRAAGKSCFPKLRLQQPKLLLSHCTCRAQEIIFSTVLPQQGCSKDSQGMWTKEFWRRWQCLFDSHVQKEYLVNSKKNNATAMGKSMPRERSTTCPLESNIPVLSELWFMKTTDKTYFILSVASASPTSHSGHVKVPPDMIKK